jgi:hypothetical protein
VTHGPLAKFRVSLNALYQPEVYFFDSKKVFMYTTKPLHSIQTLTIQMPQQIHCINNKMQMHRFYSGN